MEKFVKRKEVDFMKTKAKDLLQRYMEQDSKEENLVYNDEIRAEADCCESCSECCDFGVGCNDCIADCFLSCGRMI